MQRSNDDGYVHDYGHVHVFTCVVSELMILCKKSAYNLVATKNLHRQEARAYLLIFLERIRYD